MVLSLGNERKIDFFLCISLAYSYLWCYASKVLAFGNTKEKRVFLLYSARFALTLYPKYEKDEETLY